MAYPKTRRANGTAQKRITALCTDAEFDLIDEKSQEAGVGKSAYVVTAAVEKAGGLTEEKES